MSILCYYDTDQDRRRAEVTGIHPVVSGFLEQDVQYDIDPCFILLSLIQQAIEGSLDEWSGTGNAHTVTINRECVTIENIWSDYFGTGVYTHEDFAECVASWKQFLLSLPRP